MRPDGGGGGRRTAEVVGEDAAGVTDDPDVQHLGGYWSCQVDGLQVPPNEKLNPAMMIWSPLQTSRSSASGSARRRPVAR